MEMNPQKSLDAELESVINARKTSPGQRIVWVIALAIVAFIGYVYRGPLMSLISRSSSAANASVDPNTGGNGTNGRGGRGGGRGGGGGGAISVLALPVRKAD